jgi:hypothetical protein
MGVLDRLAARVEAMVEPAVEITQQVVQASADLASSSLRFVEREMGYLERELRRGRERLGPRRGKKR